MRPRRHIQIYSGPDTRTENMLHAPLFIKFKASFFSFQQVHHQYHVGGLDTLAYAISVQLAQENEEMLGVIVTN